MPCLSWLQVGWFGIQAEIAGEGLQAALPMPWPWLWTVLNGILVTIVAAFGFHYIVGVAWVTGPAFFVVLIWACAASLQHPKLVKQEASAELSLLEGTGIVVGGYIDTCFGFSHFCIFFLLVEPMWAHEQGHS